MKRIVSIIIILAVALTAFTGCTAPAAQPSPVPVVDEVTGAVSTAIPTVTVNGEGELTLEPDMVTMQFGVSIRSKATAAEAMQAAAEAMQAVHDVLSGLKIADADMQTTNFSIYEQYRYDGNGNTIGKPLYDVSNTLQVKFYDLENTGSIIDAAIAAGATNTYNLTFGLRDPKAYEAQALALAMENAKERANVLAQASSKQVGDVLLLNDGAQITEQVYTTMDQSMARGEMVADSSYDGAYKTSISAGTLKVTAHVTARFTLR